MSEFSDNEERLLVTYGYHLEEQFAHQVGIEFAKLDLSNVVVAKWKGIRGLNRMAQFRRDVGAKYGVDLHDDTPSELEVQDYFGKHPELLQKVPKYDMNAHMGFKKAQKLLTPFMETWNREHGYECTGSGCDCYYLDQMYYGKKRPCRKNVITLEFNKILPGVTLNEAVNFLKELVEYLQSDG